jgi:hypothetical protein
VKELLCWVALLNLTSQISRFALWLNLTTIQNWLIFLKKTSGRQSIGRFLAIRNRRRHRGVIKVESFSLENLLKDWDRWSDKLENLLRELIWLEAWLKVDAGVHGQRDMVYTASDEVICTFKTDKPQKTHPWSVEKRFA